MKPEDSQDWRKGRRFTVILLIPCSSRHFSSTSPIPFSPSHFSFFPIIHYILYFFLLCISFAAVNKIREKFQNNKHCFPFLIYLPTLSILSCPFTLFCPFWLFGPYLSLHVCKITRHLLTIKRNYWLRIFNLLGTRN